MLKWEREQMGLTARHVSDKLKVNLSEVHAWEDGDAMPSLADLRRLAELYLCPVGHFFLDSPLPEIQQLDFRGLHEKKVATLSYSSRRRLRQFMRLMELASDWLRWVDVPREAQIPVLHSIRPEEVAEEVRGILGVTWTVRGEWQTQDEAFAGWRAAIERCNVLVFALTLSIGEVRGASMWPQGGLPGILVNHSDSESATGRIFTLLHEFVHLLVRGEGVVCDFRGQREIETFANRVAARAIVLPDELESSLSDPTLEDFGSEWTDLKLDYVRRPFHASRDTIAILLEELGLVERGFYLKRRAAWDKRGFARGRVRKGQTKPQRKYRELGEVMSGLVLAAAESESVSPLDVIEVLDMPLQRLPEFTKVVQAP